jgi:hypothetical protein
VLAVLIVAAVSIYGVFFTPGHVVSIVAGTRVPPFAVPLAAGRLNGDANIARHADEGSAGKTPACSVRGREILNICQLYEQGPVVLALFINASSCTRILGELESLAPAFPGVRFAAVSIKGDRGQLRALVREHHPSLPVGYDSDGALVDLYGMVSCPQLFFIYPGGVAEGRPILSTPTSGALRARVARLVAGSRARARRPG